MLKKRLDTEIYRGEEDFVEDLSMYLSRRTINLF